MPFGAARKKMIEQILGLRRRQHRLRRRLETLQAVILQLLAFVAIERLLQRGLQHLQRRRAVLAQRLTHLQILRQKREVARRNGIAAGEVDQLQRRSPDFAGGLAGSGGQPGDLLVQRLVLGGQQRAVGGARLLRLRDRHLAVLQHGQHLTQLILRQRTQHRLAELLTNKIAYRLTVIALRQQVGELGQQLTRGASGLRLRQTAIEILLRRRKMARLQLRFAFYPHFALHARPEFRRF